jgi:hypothetical protein
MRGALGAGNPSQRFVRGTQFADFDNDGWPDLYAVGGHLAPRLVRMMATTGAARPPTSGRRSRWAQPTTLLHQ